MGFPLIRNNTRACTSLFLSLACLAKYAVFFLSCCRLSSPGDISLSLPRARRTTVTLHGFSIYGVTEIDRHLPPSLSPASLLGCMSVPSPRSLSTALIFSGRLRGCGVQAVLICMYLKIYLSLLYEARSSYHVVWRIPCGPRVETNAWLPALFVRCRSACHTNLQSSSRPSLGVSSFIMNVSARRHTWQNARYRDPR